MQRRAREATPELIDYLLQIARDSGEDARNRIVAITIMLERGWGKVPIIEQTIEENKPVPDVSRLSPEDRMTVRLALDLLGSVSNAGPESLPVDAATAEPKPASTE